MMNTRNNYMKINWTKLFFIVLGVYMVVHGHPGWGLFTCMFAITIPYKYEVDGIGDVPFDVREEDNE